MKLFIEFYDVVVDPSMYGYETHKKNVKGKVKICHNWTRKHAVKF